MSSEFKFDKIATEVLEEYGQDGGFKQRFTGFCQMAMEGKAESSDLERLIENVQLPEEDQFDAS